MSLITDLCVHVNLNFMELHLIVALNAWLTLTVHVIKHVKEINASIHVTEHVVTTQSVELSTIVLYALV